MTDNEHTSDTAGAAGLLSVEDLVLMFEEAEDATTTPRKKSETARDYYDNKQLSAAELKTLSKRGQPPYIDNVIKTKIDFLVGVEKQQRVKPQALPRTPAHEHDAQGATEALRSVSDKENYNSKRSATWKNLLIEGSGGVAVAVKENPRWQPPMGQQLGPFGPGNGQSYQQPRYIIELRRIPWDRMFYDPHSSEADFSDASYLGVVLWKDYSDALLLYGDTPEVRGILDHTMASVSASDTYDDKPKFRLWADPKRKRVRIVQIWLKRGDQWHFAEFTKGGILKAGASPYVTDSGESDCELIFQSAYVDRENGRYGLVEEMMLLQDALNKRHSKALHLLNTAQIVMTEDALSTLNSVEKVRREAARPDGTIILASGGGTIKERFQFNTRGDLAEGQVMLLQDNRRSLDTKGPNATMLGEATGGPSSASGKAIIASQQGGMIQLGDLLDNLRHLDQRVFRAIWNRIRQFWTAEEWVRVTDDERNVKWVGLNIDPAMYQQALAQNPGLAERVSGVVGNVAQLDCDITIEDAPDSLTPQLEQFQALVNLKQFDAKGELPFRAIVVAAPNLKNKDKILAEMDRASQPSDPQTAQRAQAAADLQLRGAAATVADKEASANLKNANAAKAMRDATLPADAPQAAPNEPPDPLAFEQAVADLDNTRADTAVKHASVERMQAQTDAARTQTALAPAQFAASRQDAASRAQQLAQRQPQRVA